MCLVKKEEKNLILAFKINGWTFLNNSVVGKFTVIFININLFSAIMRTIK